MIKKELEIDLGIGLHARPAAALAAAAKGLKSVVTLSYGGKTANCKNTISLMTLGAKGNVVLEIACDGEDEDEAIDVIIEVLKNTTH